MADEASIRLTVDNSQAISETNKYNRVAIQGFDNLLDKSEKYSGSLQDRIKFMERELELMRERNRLEARTAVATEERLYAEGKTTTKERKAGIAAIREDTLREEDSLKQIARLLKDWKTEQRALQLKAERMGADLARMLPGMVSADTAGGMISSASTGLLAGTIVGTLAAIGVAKEIKGAMQMEPAIRDYAVLNGTSMFNLRSNVRNLDVGRLGAMGLTPSQYYTGYAQLERSGFGKVNENMLGILAAERATGLSRNQMGALLGVERYGEGRITPLISFFERYLRSTEQSIAVLPEILQTFAQEGTVMMRATGKVNSAELAAFISTIGKQFGLSGEPLQTTVGALRQGLQQSSNPVVQALQFSTMNRAMPGASLWQMEMAMENPLTNAKYITGFLDQLKNITGGGEQYARSIYNVFGQYGISRNIANKLSAGELTNESLIEQAAKFRQTGVGGFEGRAVDVTGMLETVTAKWQGFWEKSGFANVQDAAKMLETLLGGVQTTLVELTKTNAETRDFGLNILKSINDPSNSIMEKLGKLVVGMNALNADFRGFKK